MLTFSPYETARFGLRIFRGSPLSTDAVALIEELRRERVDVAILRVPAAAHELAETISADGLPSIVADALVHYGTDLRARDGTGLESASLRLRRASGRDATNLVSMVRQTFADYPTHYHANPLFDPERILDGYAEWAVRHTEPNEEGRLAWIIEVDGQDAGFSCVQVAPDGSTARGVLNGVLPDQRGRGIYRDMLRAMLTRFAAGGVQRFVISTQAHNATVQRVWIGEQLAFERNESTVHVNALLGAT